MTSVSTRSRSLLIAIILFCSTVYAGVSWPLKGDIDLSSGFGDFRQGRFHAGLDLRTGGEIGHPAFAPVDGYIMRVKMSYTGYGKGLYLKGNDSSIYVFGHLSRFADPLDLRVKSSQLAAKRYYVELDFPSDSAKVKKGDLIAYSGQTGSGAPHLHFEKREADNTPINPLTHGFTLKDKMRPVFTRLGFQQLDNRSLFTDGSRKLFLKVKPTDSKGAYTLENTQYFNRPFGLLVDCYDLLHEGGMKLPVYHLSLYLDSKLIYDVRFDAVDFASGRSAYLEYDYLSTIKGDGDVRSLYHVTGTDFAGSYPKDSTAGRLGVGPDLAFGRHSVRIVATDAAENSSELTFQFLWGPPENLFKYDSSVVVTDTITNFYFTPVIDPAKYQIDSVVVYLNDFEQWGKPATTWVKTLNDGRLLAIAHGQRIERSVLRLDAFTQGKGHFHDEPFSGIQSFGTGKINLDCELIDDGLLVTLKANSALGSKSRIELYNHGRRLGVELPARFMSGQKYLFFVPPRPEYAHIDQIGAVMTEEADYQPTAMDSVSISLVGVDSSEAVTPDGLFVLKTGRADFFGPHYLSITKTLVVNRGVLKMNSDHYQIFPLDFVTRRDLDLSLKITTVNDFNYLSGLARVNDSGTRWVWNGGYYPDSTVRAKITRGGSYAAVVDFDPPTISNVNISEGQIIHERNPLIRFTLSDTLSGIEDDRNILIKIDGKWSIPEFDPESHICTTTPPVSLTDGEHHLSIEVTDRAGNEGHHYLKFHVTASRDKSGKK